MKYRILTSEELTHLEEELKQFLIVNHVYKEEWEKINQEDPIKAVELVELFSDYVFQKVYEKIKFLEHRSPESCLVFSCKSDSLALIAIQRKSDAVDLSTPESIHDALVNHPSELQFFTNEKPYTQTRELEIHQMVETGCVNSSEAFWMSLEKLITE